MMKCTFAGKTKKQKFILLLLFFLGEKTLSATCTYSKKSKINLVYLHGLDPDEHSTNEKTNREIIHSLSKKKSLNIFMPRSPHFCKTQRCWNYYNEDKMLESWTWLNHESIKCFNGNKPNILVAFSNGGFFLGKVYQFGLIDKNSWLITVGSSGKSRQGEKKDFSSFGKIIILIGKKDLEFSSAKKWANYLKDKNADIEFIEFSGGHHLEKTKFEEIIDKYKKNMK